MNDHVKPFDHVCGEAEAVDVSRFLDYCASTDFAEGTPGNIADIRADYAHLNRCGSCKGAFREVFSEHRRVNPSFAARTVAENMRYLFSTRDKA